MHINISTLNIGDKASGIYLVKSHGIPLTKNGDPYLKLTICDATGEISGNRFNISETDIAAYENIVDGGVVNITFSVKDYMGTKNMNITEVAAVDPATVDLSEIVPTSPIPPATLYQEMVATATSFKNEELKRVTLTAIGENEAKLKSIPAAKSVHHACVGGLALHTGGMLRLAKNIAATYAGRINEELLYAGVILHDIKKTEEFDVSPINLVTDYSVRGKLLGHITMGVDYIGNVCDRCGVSEEVKTCLQHMILSHHGTPEFGSPVYPAFIEASLLNAIDLIDSRVAMFENAVKDIPDHTFSERQFALNNVQVYKHNINPVAPVSTHMDNGFSVVDTDLTF